MQRKHWLLTALLRENSRATLKILSKKTGIPASTIFDFLRTQQGGLYKRNVALMDFGLLGFGTKAQVLIRAEKMHRAQLEEFLLKHWNINSLYKVSNGYDYLAEGIFRTMRELESFMQQLADEFHAKPNAHYVLEDMKQERFLADPCIAEQLLSERDRTIKTAFSLSLNTEK